MAAVEVSAWTLRLPHNAASERSGVNRHGVRGEAKGHELAMEDWKRSARSSCGGCRAALLRDDECCDDTRVRRHLPLSANRREEEAAR